MRDLLSNPNYCGVYEELPPIEARPGTPSTGAIRRSRGTRLCRRGELSTELGLPGAFFRFESRTSNLSSPPSSPLKESPTDKTKTQNRNETSRSTSWPQPVAPQG